MEGVPGISVCASPESLAPANAPGEQCNQDLMVPSVEEIDDVSSPKTSDVQDLNSHRHKKFRPSRIDTN
jgi:hypothetical protein